MSQLSSYDNYKQNTTADEQASLVSTGKIPVSGKLSSNDDYTTRSVQLNELLHGDENVIESISVGGTTIAPVDKTVDIPVATTSSAGVLSASDKTKLDSMAAGWPNIKGIHHKNNHGSNVYVTPDSNGMVLLPGDAGTPLPYTPDLINGGTYKITAEILFDASGCYKPDEPTPYKYTPMHCEFKFLWGDSIDLTVNDGDDVHMHTTFNVGHPNILQGYWMHRIVACYDADQSITSRLLNIGIICHDNADVGIDYTQVGNFRWSHLIIEKYDQAMFVGR